MTFVLCSTSSINEPYLWRLVIALFSTNLRQLGTYCEGAKDKLNEMHLLCIIQELKTCLCNSSDQSS